MIYVIYRILYGTDFLERSMRSVYNVADRIFVGYSTEPWSKPKNFPKITDIEKSPVKVIRENFDKKDEKIKVFSHHVDTPKGQFNYLYDYAVDISGKPDMVIFMEPDMVWAPGVFKSFIEEAQRRSSEYLFAPQIELWKSYDWRIRQRNRFGPAAYKGLIPELGFGQFTQPPQDSILSKAGCYNFGFCLNEKTMLYKHKAALDFSAKIGDSVPAETWYKDKWLNWTPNTIDLEPSAKHTHLIRQALPYKMPEDMKEYMNDNPVKNI